MYGHLLADAYDAWFRVENELTAFIRAKKLDGADDNEILRGYYELHKVPMAQACEQARQLGVLSTEDMLTVTTPESFDELWAGMGTVTTAMEKVRVRISPT